MSSVWSVTLVGIFRQVREDCCCTRAAPCVTMICCISKIIIPATPSAEKWATNECCTGHLAIFMIMITREVSISRWVMFFALMRIGDRARTQPVLSRVTVVTAMMYSLLVLVSIYYRARIINWRCIRLNSKPDCVAISKDIARHGSNSEFWISRKMLDLFILILMFSLLNCNQTLRFQ